MTEGWQIFFAAISAVALLLTAYTGWRRRTDQANAEAAKHGSDLAMATSRHSIELQSNLLGRVHRLEEQNQKLVTSLIRSRLALRRERERCDKKMADQRKELLALLARYRRGNGCELRRDDPIKGGGQSA